LCKIISSWGKKRTAKRQGRSLKVKKKKVQFVNVWTRKKKINNCGEKSESKRSVQNGEIRFIVIEKNLENKFRFR